MLPAPCSLLYALCSMLYALCSNVNSRILRIRLNESPSRRNIITHQHAESTICFECIVDANPAENAVIRIHGSFPKLLCIHLTETLVPLHFYTATFITGSIYFNSLLTFCFIPRSEERRVGTVCRSRVARDKSSER